MTNLTRQLFTVTILSIAIAGFSQSDNDPYVVVLSMDGFRWDYTESVPTPHFDSLARHGVKAESMIPSFPTKTFPNHYTMATGLYPDHHGIVLNSFYDPQTGLYYSIMDRESVGDGSFYGGEPVWITAEKQNVTSAVYFWVGSETQTQGYRPTYWKDYDHDFPFGQRIDSVISWLQKPEENRPHLVMFYFDEPDGTGHNFGPESNEIDAVIIELDSLLGVLVTQLNSLDIANNINLIITSDHGMAATSPNKIVVLENHLKENWINQIQGYNPNFLIRAEEGYKDSIYRALVDVEGITSWFSDRVPERLHFGENPRALDIVVVADSSWSVVLHEQQEPGQGAHGYDNRNTDMHTIFYASGPAFKQDFRAHSFYNVNLYSIICEVLRLEPAPTDGLIEDIKDMFK